MIIPICKKCNPKSLLPPLPPLFRVYKQFPDQYLIPFKQIGYPLAVVIKRTAVGGFYRFVKFLVGFL
jgi:hypothetical protein